MTEGSGSYHHGNLRAAAIAGAVAEIERVGAAGVSMREVARLAGVTHAALAYQFKDKAGMFTAVAAEGFRRAAASIGPAATGADGFMRGGGAYIAFALAQPGYFEVMFRPDLYRADDPELIEARDAAFAILYGSARASLGAEPDDDVAGVVVAGWALSHGFAALLGTGNLHGRISGDVEELTTQLAQGIVRLGDLAARYVQDLRLGADGPCSSETLS